MFGTKEETARKMFYGQGSCGSWKVMEIDNAILQDLESFGKREVFQNGYGNVLDFCLGKF